MSARVARRPRIRWPGRARVLRAVTVLAIATAGITPYGAARPALAQRLPTDSVGDTALRTLGPDDAVAAPDIDAVAGVLESADGRALWARRPDARRAIASISKIMVALVVLERANLDDTVTVSKTAADVPYALGLRAGEKRTVRQLLELALVGSSNDAAYALAEHVGGTAPAFVAAMNEKAAELGLGDSRFINPHGLDAAGHRSSAFDVALLMRVAMKDPEFRRIVAIEEVTLPAYKRRKSRKVENTNELLSAYRGMLGGKTGFTKDAKYGVVTTAERRGVTLTAVVLGARNNKARFANSKRLLDWGFRHLRRKTVATATETVGAIPLVQDPTRKVEARFAETTTAVVFDFDGPVKRALYLQERVSLPVFKGQELGRADLVQGERLVATVPVVAAAAIASVAETVGTVPVREYIDRSVVARAADTSVPVRPFSAATPARREVRLRAAVRAPVAVGDRLGEIVYSQDGTTIAEVPVVAATAAEAPGVVERISTWFARRWRSLTGRPTMAAVQLVQ